MCYTFLNAGPPRRPFVGRAWEHIAVHGLDIESARFDEPAERTRREAPAIGKGQQVVLREDLTREPATQTAAFPQGVAQSGV